MPGTLGGAESARPAIGSLGSECGGTAGSAGPVFRHRLLAAGVPDCCVLLGGSLRQVSPVGVVHPAEAAAVARDHGSRAEAEPLSAGDALTPASGLASSGVGRGL